jgi:hypothetical protein
MARRVPEIYPLVIKTPYLIKTGAAYTIFPTGNKVLLKIFVMLVARDGHPTR